MSDAFPESPLDLRELRSRASDHGQEHLFRHWDDLCATGRRALLADVAGIDFPLMRRLAEEHLAARNDPPPGDMAPAPTLAEGQDPALDRAAREAGCELLAEGRVAAFLVAGGQGTRLGCAGPKGCVPATPVRARPLFQVFAEKLRAAERRFGRAIPFYVMTSPENEAATRRFFAEAGDFGLRPGTVRFVVQGMLPAIDFGGRIILRERDRVFLSPDGHGGSLKALSRAGALREMTEQGVEEIFYFQVDNPLVRLPDPLFLGHHRIAGAEMSAKVVPKRDPMERVGVVGLVGGRCSVIEYSDLPDALRHARDPRGELLFGAGNIAIHVLRRSFVERLTGTGLVLPYHAARKAIPGIDAAGRPVRPSEPNGIKFETFVFDALSAAGRVTLLSVDRRGEFSPIKNREGDDSLATAVADQCELHARWLEAAGWTVPRNAEGRVSVRIEISPLFAATAEELLERLPPGGSVMGDFVLEP